MTTQPETPVQTKILVIDDNPIIQRAVYFALRDHGYQVLMTGEVTSAMSIVRKELPALILLDLSFPPDTVNIGGPLQDGFFFIEWVRRTPEFEKIPILVVSSSEPKSYQDRVTAIGVNRCFQKPLSKEALLAAVQSAIGGNSQPRPAG